MPNLAGTGKGTFDYAHLRVPLPKDLSGSEIFALKNMTAYPESYFLMVRRQGRLLTKADATQRRSSDGYISATGMFKAAFPWASHKEEDAERQYHKKFSSAGDEEVAGSVWLAPEEGKSSTLAVKDRLILITHRSASSVRAIRHASLDRRAAPPRPD